ncbi:hypothetical protein GGTG_05685 [Gaeumannomyces tritici R3-111a-1]|uniref:Uncharacterized protein n=1 Tax=Gaeumannomyces tritici (strain R3-111a-1) TaxID=644352 RepID=J3NWM3_GAET3|nr:hypothetical protein GGTG_05685 [Gaeumannomyces tritici R3-111a-1]EJT75755.1 hypothetical protein GGTG_05685 [Gaeumannomyces tritici R3-111a-1]
MCVDLDESRPLSVAPVTATLELIAADLLRRWQMAGEHGNWAMGNPSRATQRCPAAESSINAVAATGLSASGHQAKRERAGIKLGRNGDAEQRVDDGRKTAAADADCRQLQICVFAFASNLGASSARADQRGGVSGVCRCLSPGSVRQVQGADLPTRRQTAHAPETSASHWAALPGDGV